MCISEQRDSRTNRPCYLLVRERYSETSRTTASLSLHFFLYFFSVFLSFQHRKDRRRGFARNFDGLDVDLARYKVTYLAEFLPRSQISLEKNLSLSLFFYYFSFYYRPFYILTEKKYVCLTSLQDVAYRKYTNFRRNFLYDVLLTCFPYFVPIFCFFFFFFLRNPLHEFAVKLT